MFEWSQELPTGRIPDSGFALLELPIPTSGDNEAPIGAIGSARQNRPGVIQYPGRFSPGGCGRDVDLASPEVDTTAAHGQELFAVRAEVHKVQMVGVHNWSPQRLGGGQVPKLPTSLLADGKAHTPLVRPNALYLFKGTQERN